VRNSILHPLSGFNPLLAGGPHIKEPLAKKLESSRKHPPNAPRPAVPQPQHRLEDRGSSVNGCGRRLRALIEALIAVAWALGHIAQMMCAATSLNTGGPQKLKLL
jgi:hypothetical protein